VHALARAAKAASAVDEEAKTLRPGSKGGGIKVGASAGAKQQQRGGRLFSPYRLQGGSTQPVKQVGKQEQDALTAHVQQTPQHRRAQQLHDQDDIVSPREESGGDDVRDAAVAALLRIALIVTDATETMMVTVLFFSKCDVFEPQDLALLLSSMSELEVVVVVVVVVMVVIMMIISR
jgi:hypothetical protein